ncbi:unnamed protein product [Brassica rapa]|uniref:Uncharacterized protein n=1 Tax=Brassica campestris TaxID=3711 RepID=A0A8D9G1S6_BRACM|nr:unnamed protein product [Brassica rapa]
MWDKEKRIMEKHIEASDSRQNDLIFFFINVYRVLGWNWLIINLCGIKSRFLPVICKS